MIALSAGCAQSPSLQSSSSLSPTEPVLNDWPYSEQSTLQVKQGFDAATLYSLLVAELSERQGFPEVTLHHYLQQARNTGDLGILQRATEIAEYTNDDVSFLEATLIWTELEPDNSLPFSIASEQLIRQGRFTEAKPLVQVSLEAKRYLVAHIMASHSQLMTADERQSYLSLFDELLQQYPDNVYYLYAKATLLNLESRYEEALLVSQKALQSDPEYLRDTYLRAVVLEAELQDRLGHLDTAIAHLEQHLAEVDRKRYRNRVDFRLLYTRLLLQKERFPEAEAQAELAIVRNRHNEDLLFYLGVLMLEHQRLDESERFFNLMHDLTGLTAELRYYHGRIAQLRGQRQQALEHFTRVDDPRYLVSSFNEIGNILNQAEDQTQLSALFTDLRGMYPNYAPLLYGIESYWLVEQAMNNNALTLLNEALMRYPDDVRLLYNRALVSEKLNNLPQMEMDLRKVLQVQPLDVTTLNALGYDLTDRGQDIESHDRENHDFESQSLQNQNLARQALTSKADDPAILESMGWVLHNSGDLEGALYYLKKTYDINPDPRIAAHLGTLYWKLGQADLALQIWDKSLKEHPDHPLLNKCLAIAGDPF